jgi:hypothetical protein
MSSTYDNTNKGILGRNDRKTLDTHPDFSGSINVEGREYWLSGWVKERKDGSGRFFSLSVKPKDADAVIRREVNAIKADLDDDIPF